MTSFTDPCVSLPRFRQDRCIHRSQRVTLPHSTSHHCHHHRIQRLSLLHRTLVFSISSSFTVSAGQASLWSIIMSISRMMPSLGECRSSNFLRMSASRCAQVVASRGLDGTSTSSSSCVKESVQVVQTILQERITEPVVDKLSSKFIKVHRNVSLDRILQKFVEQTVCVPVLQFQESVEVNMAIPHHGLSTRMCVRAQC